MAVDHITLYGNSQSGNCLKPRWIAKHLGVDYEWKEVDLLSGHTRTEEFLKLNPAGQVPLAVLPDGRTLAQSNAIMLYLAEENRSDLIPDDPFERAKMMEWLFWEQHGHERYVAERRFMLHIQKTPESEIDPEFLAKGRRALARMEMALLSSDFLVGDRLTLADVALVAYTRVAHEGGFDLSEFPAVQAWVARTERALDIPHAQEAA